MAILAPYGRLPNGAFPSEAASIGADGRYLCPHDPQHHAQGEDGYYSDSPLGEGGASGPQIMSQGPVPSDFQTAVAYRYTPSVRGWTSTDRGWIQGQYYPQPPGHTYYPASPAPLGDAASVAASATNAATGYSAPMSDEAARQEAYRKQVTFWMQVITGSIIGASALLAVFRSLKGLRHDQFIRSALEKKLL